MAEKIIKDSFVYCWTDIKTNILYVGVHKGKIDDGYICSSKIMLKEYKKRPYDFVRQIVATGDYRSMYDFESLILRLENVSTNKNYYNKAQNNGYFLNKGKPLSEDHKNKIKNYFKKNDHPMLGKSHSHESKAKMRESRLRYMRENDITMRGENHPMFGKKHSKSHCENIGNSLRGKKRFGENFKLSGQKRSGVYQITFPDGSIEVIKNLHQFCIKNLLNTSNMLNRGKSKGYLCKNLHTKEIPNVY